MLNLQSFTCLLWVICVDDISELLTDTPIINKEKKKTKFQKTRAVWAKFGNQDKFLIFRTIINCWPHYSWLPSLSALKKRRSAKQCHPSPQRTHTQTHTQFISQLIHNQKWHSLLLPLFHLPHFCSHIPKYHAAEQHTLPVSPGPISVVLQHCYLPVMVAFSCLLPVCRNSKCFGATGSCGGGVGGM